MNKDFAKETNKQLNNPKILKNPIFTNVEGLRNVIVDGQDQLIVRLDPEFVFIFDCFSILFYSLIFLLSISRSGFLFLFPLQNYIFILFLGIISIIQCFR